MQLRLIDFTGHERVINFERMCPLWAPGSQRGQGRKFSLSKNLIMLFWWLSLPGKCPRLKHIWSPFRILSRATGLVPKYQTDEVRSGHGLLTSTVNVFHSTNRWSLRSCLLTCQLVSYAFQPTYLGITSRPILLASGLSLRENHMV